jgi:hypothetical protein
VMKSAMYPYMIAILTLNLSFLAVGPPIPSTPAEVPLIAIITVSFLASAN